MSPERWQQIEAVLQSALDLVPAERAGFLDEECAHDAELRREVEKLMRTHDEADSFIEVPAWTGSSLFDSLAKKQIVAVLQNDFDPQDQFIGREVGAFRLIKELGRGGMGAVYLAEREDNLFKQRAAIKFIKRGMDTDLILRRFRNERQILAALNHPHIARLLDGGTTSDGLPYFVMEYVEGKSLYKFCDENKLNVHERLKIFRRLCEAVEAAHQIQVVHRDLKPSNILVKTDGTPKLLDFGIAKLLDADLAAATLEPTATQMRMMTPEYASPEQVSGEPVSAASDIYSLGVMLYELVTGHRPYRLKKRAMHEVARVICEENPTTPSESLTREDNLVQTNSDETITLDFVFEARGNATPESLRRELIGDLDKIVLRTLRKNPLERYQSAVELADDIARYMEKRPVAAETFSFVQKTIQPPITIEKNSVAILPFKTFGSASGAGGNTGDEFLGLGLADALVTRLSGVRRLVVRPTSSVLNFGETADPFGAGKELAVNFVVDGNIRRAGERIRVTIQLLNVQANATVWAQTFDEQFTDVLALEDSISERVAKSLIPQFTGEEELLLQKRGTNNHAAYEAYLRGRFHWNQFTPDSLPKALQSFQKATELDANYALAHVGLADFYIWANIYGLMPSAAAGQLAEAAARRAVELDDASGEAYSTLGLVLQNRMDWIAAEKFYRRALKLNPNHAQAHEWYAALLVGSGKFVEGAAEIRLAEQLDPLSLRTKTLVSWTLFQARNFAEALDGAQQIIELDSNYPQGYSQIGINLWAMGRREEALLYFQKFDALIPDSALAKYQLCFALVAVHREADARRVFAEIEQLARDGYVKPYFLGMAHTAFNELDQAFRYFQQSADENEPWMLWFGTDPMLENLRDDYRYVELLERMNNPIVERFKSRAIQPEQNALQINEQIDLALIEQTAVNSNEKPEKSIAVLPLKILTANTGGDDDFLGVGLADAMITRLSSVRRLVVRPTSSILRFDDCRDSFAAGRELAVDFVLCGTIRRAGTRLRVSVQLLDVAANSTVWAEKFDEEFTDVLALEDLVAEKVGKLLIPQLTGEEQQRLAKRPTDNRAAYEAFLRGRYHWNTFTPEGFSKALLYYNEAVAHAPDYALAYAGIADYWNFLGVYAVMPFAETAAAAKEAAQTAIALDDRLGEAYAALGFAALMRDFDWEASERHLRRSIELNPNYATGRVWHCYLLAFQGKFELALSEIKRALEIDRLTPIVAQTLNWTLYHAGRFDEAIAGTRRLIEREPLYGLSHLFLSSVLWHVGRHAEAIEICRRAVELLGRSPYTLVWLAAAYAAAGDGETMRTLLDEINRMSVTHYVSPYLVAMIHSNAGNRETAFEQLERAVEIGDARIIWLGIDPQFKLLRDDSRYQNLLRRTKNPLAAKDPAPTSGS